MRGLRPLAFAVVIAAVFFWWTSHRPGGWKPALIGGGRPDKIELTEAAQSQQVLDPDEQVNVAVYKKALPSVVNITATSQSFNFFYGIVPSQGQGTGFILDKEGHILTNYHVVANVAEARSRGQVDVTLSNRKRYRAQLIGRDPIHDLAILKIEAQNLTPAVLGDSRTLVVGQKVFAIGNPFGLSGTMTRGIVSSIRPVETENGARIDDAIQTDAAINPGNSGGPLLNSRGEVVGINSMIVTGGAGQSAGVGFAIPINTAKALLNDLITTGTVRRPSLGIAAALPIGPELADELGLAADYGVLIVGLQPGGPAERAGLHGGSGPTVGNTPIRLGGDLIVGIDGQDVESLQDIARVMNNHRSGDTVTISVFRGKRKLDVKVTLGEARGAS